MSGDAIARINYYEGDLARFIKGKYLGEDDFFVKIELDNYVLRIAKKQIIKIEINKSRGGW